MKSDRYPIGPFVAPNEVNDNDIQEWIETIEKLPGQLSAAVNGWTEEQLSTPYREGGWTVKQLIHHVSDSHMNSLMRFKLGLTENNPTIKTYDQDGWSGLPDYENLPVEVSLSLLKSIHLKMVSLFRNMNNEDFQRTIFHPEMNKSISLAKLLALYNWHSRHHLAHIIKLKESKSW